MKTRIQVHTEGKFFIAEDIVTNVADQGLTEKEAISNLKKGVKGRKKALNDLLSR